MGRTPSLTAQARCLDFYEWGKNGERESGSECDKGGKEGRYSGHRGNVRTDLQEEDQPLDG